MPVKMGNLGFGQRAQVFVKSSPARMTLILAAFLFILTIILNPASLNPNTFASIFILTVLLSIASAGQTIVLIGGGLDFTVGAVMSGTAILTTYIMNGQDGRFLQVFVIAMGIGLLVGFLNGFICSKVNLPPMILTMAISNVVTRMQYVLTQGHPGGYAAPAFISTIFYKIGGVVPAIIMYAAIIWPLVFYILNRSTFGKQLFLVGSNPQAAVLNGINANKIKILSYVFSGVLCAFAGMLGGAYIQSARCQLFDNYAFESLIAVIVGGTAFTGGVGSFAGSIAGSLLMVVLSNGLTVLALPQTISNITLGCVMVLLLIVYNRAKAVRQ